MREILFRGKAKDGYKWIEKGEWIEGSLLCYDDENGTVCQLATSYFANNKDEPVMLTAYEVDPETVCQYTGLTDKNGRKIFEGDIILHEMAGKIKVRFEKSEFMVIGIDRTMFRAWLSSIHGNFKIIGNIFDNPELIGEQP